MVETRTPGTAGKGQRRTFTGALTDTYTWDVNGVGAIRQEKDKVYKWVKYNQGTATVTAVAGNAVVYEDRENSEVNGDVSDGQGLGAGMLMAAIAHGSYGWIQIKGEHVTNQALAGSPAAGEALVLSSTDGELTKSGGSAGEQVVAYAYDVANKKIVCEFPL